jgi:hypothetical protein
MSEITVLFGSDKPASKWTLMMVHEAKKLAGAEVTDRITKTREEATDEETGARV